ncbi:MAG: nucleotidyltransferase domain-containing protein, partial [Pseudomonadota bacterium]
LVRRGFGVSTGRARGFGGGEPFAERRDAEAKASAASGAAQATAASGCAGADGRDGPPLAGVLDVAALRKRLAAAEPSGSPRRDAEAAADETSRERRAAAAAVLRAALTEGRGRIETAFFDRRLTGRQAAAAIAWLTDRIVAATVQFVIERAPGGGAGARSERLSVIAVGGYGRGEMAPFSDVDLLFLTPYKTTAWAETVVEGVLYMLWDLKLKVGHATRTVDECLRLAAQDMTIRTTLLETRLIEGSGEAYETLERRLRGELLPGAGSAFVRAKLAEREERHERTGGSRYMLEPHVKDGKGGLRDIHTLYWISGHLYGSHDRAALIEKGVFTAEETSRLENAANHLWTVRCGMHYVAGRAQEKLTFDLQVELAERFGYRRTTGARPVERFMKRTYIAARAIGELTRIFCAALEQQHQKDPPLLGGLRRLFPTARRGAPAPDGMEMKDGRLTLSDPAAIAERPILLLRLFEEAIRAEILTHPHALRVAARARRPVERLREDP